MSWTEERVAKLAKLWADGLSASQVATQLGGVTRNAVIGKVHRLGLSGRAKPAGKSNGGARKKTSSERSGGAGGYARPTRPARAGVGRGGSNIAVALKVKPVEEVIAAPESLKLTLMELTESTCKWPTGDPTMPGFSFCGHKTSEDKPYCAFHNKLAFQPPSERRRRR
ncbi:MAG: GcrA family cell cycle regulator [Rhizobiaceae bacterium]